MVYLLDTSALLVFFHREKGAERIAPLLENPEHEFLLCAVSIAEFGRKLREKGMPQEERDRILGQFLMLFTDIVPADESVASASLRLLDQMPGRLPLADSLIAAAAATRAACLVHKDKHLAAIPESALSQINLLA